MAGLPLQRLGTGQTSMRKNTMFTFTTSKGKKLQESDILNVLNDGAHELHATELGVRKISRQVAEMIERSRLEEAGVQGKIFHVATYLGGNRDIRITADGGDHFWVRWDDESDTYMAMSTPRFIPAYPDPSRIPPVDGRENFLAAEGSGSIHRRAADGEQG